MTSTGDTEQHGQGMKSAAMHDTPAHATYARSALAQRRTILHTLSCHRTAQQRRTKGDTSLQLSSIIKPHGFLSKLGLYYKRTTQHTLPAHPHTYAEQESQKPHVAPQKLHT